MASFNKNKASMFDHTKQRWGLRKLSIGVASVLLGFTFMGVQAQNVSADTNTSTGDTDEAITTNNQQTNGNQVVLAASQQNDTVNQTPVVPDGYADVMNGFRPNIYHGNSTPAIINASTEGIIENGGDPSSTRFNNIGAQLDGQGNVTSITMSASNYKSNPADAAEAVDLQNLTPDQQNEITTFAAQVINRLRAEVQAQPNGQKVSAGFLKVSPFATQAGQDIVHFAYDNFTGVGHNQTGISDAANRLGIHSYVGENIGGLLLGRAMQAGWIHTANMDQLKNDIYLSILSMMYTDNGNNAIGAGGHTTALLNDPAFNSSTPSGGNAISLDSNGNIIANQYLALTIDKQNRLHFNFISDANASEEAKRELALDAVQPMFEASKPDQGHSSSAESSATSSAESSATSSAESSATSSAESSATSSAESSATSSAESSATSSAESSATSSAESSATSSAESSATSSAESSATSSAESSATSSAESSATSSAESSATSSAESSATSSAESSATSSAESSTTSSAESSATSSAESSATSSAESSATSSAESSATSSAESSATSSAESSAISSAESSATSSAESSATSSAESSATSSAEADASAVTVDTNNSAANSTVLSANNVSSVTNQSQANKGNANNKLPQTGDANEQSLFALGVLGMSAILGLGLRKKRN